MIMSKVEEADITGQPHLTSDILEELQKIHDESSGQRFDLKRIIISSHPSNSSNNADMKIPSLEISVFDSIDETEVV